MSDRKHITGLFEKYISNNCTEAELNDLINIIKAEENKALVEELMATHMEGETDILLPQEVSDRVFNRLTLQPVVTPMRKWWYKIAAAVAVVLLSVVIYKMETKPGADLAVEKKDVPPGGNRATLVLADGTEVTLDDLQVGSVAEESGAMIQKTADGLLEYVSGTNRNSSGTNVVKTPKGGQYVVVLPDGSRVWLNAASSLTYSASFGNTDRTVKLSGEAYFEVVPIRNNGKRMPFFVETNKQRIEVLGTRFNVNAYDDGNGIKTTLIEGRVKVVTETEAVILKPNQEFNLRPDGINTQQVDVETSIDWKNGDFIFAEEDIRSVMRKVSRWYNIDVVFENEVGSSREMISGQISRSRNLSEVLRMLELSGTLRMELKDNKIHIYSNH